MYLILLQFKLILILFDNLSINFKKLIFSNKK